ncbi:Ig-like domain repeat protein [Methanobrevibacter sp.]|uniref:Ig-like domain-containing protein n=1 Tax=Methanobrevibacter sp. TaxID=66852 RepID=UPI00386D76EA
MFKIFEPITVDLINITLIDGYTTPMPYSLITAYGEGVIVNIDGCEFRNNTCLNGATIAISHGASVYVDNSRFVDNKCILIQSTGGAIYVLDGYLKVSNSEFVNNTACDGGAIYVGYPGTVDIINSTFTDNIAYNGTVVLGGGGAIYTKGMTKIVNSSFIRNYADLYGGAIYIAGGDAKIFKSYFENNTVGYGTTIKGSAIESEPWTTFNFKMEYSVLITDDTHNDIALFSNNEDSEITLNYNYWGSNTWSYRNTNVPVSDYVIIQPRTSTTPVYKDGEVYIDVEFKNYDTVNKRVTDLYDYVHDYAVEISSALNNVEYDTVTISNNLAQDKYYANVAGEENILVNGIPLNFNVVESDKKDVNANITILPGNTTTIIVQVPDDLANNVSITVKNTEFSRSCGNGTIIVTMNTLPGNYKVVVSYGEDDTYKGFSETSYFEIPKFPTNINVIVDDIVEEQSAYVDINVTKGATGNLVIIINGKYRYESVIENGTSFKVIYDLPVGNYTVDVFYDGDEYHAPANASTTFTVSERPVEPDEPIDGYAYIFVKTGDLTTITVRVPADLSKNVTITVNDDVYSKESGDGTITLTIPTGEGDYSVVVNYAGDEKYNPFSESYMFKIYDYCWFINETGYRTLREAVEAAGDGDVIKGNISVYETDETVNIGHREIPSEPWEIVKNITITSMTDDPVTIRGHSHRLFYIDKDSHLTLSNLILTGSDVGYLDGGAVENTYDSYVTIRNCTFTNFNADRGGALFIWGKAEVIDSVFINNNAEIGGAIFVLSPVTNDNNVIFENVTLINNTADSYGAGIYISGSTYNTTFVNNSRFINNTGHGKGGAIYVESGNVKIENTLFDSNKAIHYDFYAEVELAGGAVFVSRYANADITNTQFINNYAEEYGGALACDNTILMFQDLTTGETDTTYYFTNIVGCSFINNTAGISAGAIYLGFNSLPTVTIVNSTFDSNGAPEAGVISTNFADLLISDCEFKNNVASGASLITTYGTYSDDRYDATTRIVGSKFTNNNVKYVINQLNMYTILTVEDSVFYEDAVILINKGSATLSNLTQERTNNDYAVVNNGTLSLNKNDFINPIRNGGTISSETYIVVLNNETISVEIGSTYTLRAIVCDDNGNIIEKGNLVFIVNGEEVNANYANIGFIADYEVGNGSYLISARYSDAGLTNLKVRTAQIIAKKSIDMLINMENITVGQDVTITVNVPSQVSGNISVKIGDNISVLPIKNGEARFVISGVESGDYAVEIVYSGNDEYASKIEVVNLTVFKINDYTFDVDVSDVTADSAVIDINLPEDYNGNVTLSIDGKNQSVVIDNGKANVYIGNLTIGSHTAEVIFEGNEKYAGDKFTIPFTVSKYESFVKISVNDIVVGNSAIINLILPDDATGDVIITINNKTRLVTASYGSAVLVVPNLDVGNYAVYANYIGDNRYLDSENSTSFNVVDNIKDTVIELSIKGNDIEGILREVNGNPISGALISYGIGNILNKEVITGLNGEFVVSANRGDKITFRYAGNNVISGSYAVITLDDSSNESSNKKDVVIEVVSKFSSIAVDTAAGEKGGILYATIKDSNGNVLSGKSVKIQVGKSQYNVVSDKNGKVAIKLNFNAAGTFNHVLSFDGDDQYNKSPLASAKLTVSKKKTSISAKAKKFKASKKVKKYKVTLKTVKNKYNGKTYLKAGMKLTLKIKGKKYVAKTNKKGKATFKIKKLSKKGKYKATIKFKGDKTYKASSKKVTIRIR